MPTRSPGREALPLSEARNNFTRAFVLLVIRSPTCIEDSVRHRETRIPARCVVSFGKCAIVFIMNIAGYEFIYICNIEPVRADDGSVQHFMPQARYQNAHRHALHRYGSGPFCKFKIPSRIPSCGVYALAVAGEILYVGECENLMKRFNYQYGNISPRNCFKNGRETNCRLNSLIYSKVQQGKHISLYFFQTSNYKSVESSLRSTLKPAWNLI